MEHPACGVLNTSDVGFQHGGQNIHYLEKRMAEQKEQAHPPAH